MGKAGRHAGIGKKIVMVLEAAEKPLSRKEIAAHPTMRDITPTQLGNSLSHAKQAGHIRYHKKSKLYTPTSSSPPAKVPVVRAAPTKMFFVVNPAEKTVMLDVGGLRLPVVIE